MTTKVMVVGSEKGNPKRRPRIRLAGFWLNEIGFKYESLATADYEPGRIVIKLQGSGIDTYSQVVKEVLASKGGLLQVRLEWHNKKKTPHLEIKGLWLENFGFTIGSVFVVQAEYGQINIHLVDLNNV
jgi:HSP20-like domain of unknown function (DUF1813).